MRISPRRANRLCLCPNVLPPILLVRWYAGQLCRARGSSRFSTERSAPRHAIVSNQRSVETISGKNGRRGFGLPATAAGRPHAGVVPSGSRVRSTNAGYEESGECIRAAAGASSRASNELRKHIDRPHVNYRSVGQSSSSVDRSEEPILDRRPRTNGKLRPPARPGLQPLTPRQ